MIYRHTLAQVEEYKETGGINQSALKVLLIEGIEAFLMKRDEVQRQTDLYYDEPKHFLIGTAVDIYFTHGKTVFDGIYAISKLLKKPVEKPLSIIHMVFDRVKATTSLIGRIHEYAEEFYKASDEHQYFMNRRIPKEGTVTLEMKNLLTGNTEKKKFDKDPRTWVEDKRFENMIKDGIAEAYWEELKDNIGKQLLSGEESTTINAVINSISTHKHTSYLFQEEENVDHIYQMPLYFELNGVWCKILPDKMTIDHNEGTIMPFDIKTLGRYVTTFNKEVRYRRYDIQGALYTKGIDLNRKAISELIGKDITNYELQNFSFIVESTLKPGVPLVYPLSDEVLKEGIYGNPEEDLKGCKDALDLYKNWMEIDFSVAKKYEETNGVVVLEKGYHKIRI